MKTQLEQYEAEAKDFNSIDIKLNTVGNEYINIVWVTDNVFNYFHDQKNGKSVPITRDAARALLHKTRRED